MTDKAAREAKNRYLREWRKRNPERVRAAEERYWARKAKEEAKESDAEKQN